MESPVAFPVHYEYFPREIKQEILLRVQDEFILAVSLVDKATNNLCDEIFWRLRFMRRFGTNLDKSKKNGIDIKYKSVYIELMFFTDKEIFLRSAYKGYLELIHLLVETQIIDANTKFDRSISYRVYTHNNYGIDDDRCINIQLFHYACNNAARSGCFDVLTYLFEQVVDPYYAAIDCNWNTSIEIAAENGHLNLVQYLIERGADIHRNNNYSIRMASENGHLDVVKYLIEHGATLSGAFDGVGANTAGGGHLEMLKFLIEKGADINDMDEESGDALMQASGNGHLDIVKWLIDHGANVNSVKDNIFVYTPLVCAVYGKHFDIVKYLIDHGADIHAVGNDEAARDAAADEKIMKYLVDCGIDIHYRHDSPLVHAAARGDTNMVDYLLKIHEQHHGGNCYCKLINNEPDYLINYDDYWIHYVEDINDILKKGTFDIIGYLVKNSLAGFVLKLAAKHGVLDLVDKLIKGGTDVHAYNDSALIAACDMYGECNLDVVNYLIEMGANINAQNDAAFVNACGNCCFIENTLPLVSLLIEHGANVNVKNSQALKDALWYERIYLAVCLTMNGAIITDADINDELLTLATTHGHLDMVKLLVENGAPTNRKLLHSDSDAIFMTAVEHGHLTIVAYLMRLYLDEYNTISMEHIKYKMRKDDSRYERAAMLAINKNKPNVFKYIIESWRFSYLHPFIVEASKRGNLIIVQYLVEKGVYTNTTLPPDSVLKSINDAIRYAADNGYLNIVQYFHNKQRA